jgi:hypothetical protein
MLSSLDWLAVPTKVEQARRRSERLEEEVKRLEEEVRKRRRERVDRLTGRK